LARMSNSPKRGEKNAESGGILCGDPWACGPVQRIGPERCTDIGSKASAGRRSQAGHRANDNCRASHAAIDGRRRQCLARRVRADCDWTSRHSRRGRGGRQGRSNPDQPRVRVFGRQEAQGGRSAHDAVPARFDLQALHLDRGDAAGPGGQARTSTKTSTSTSISRFRRATASRSRCATS